ncbi:hypothetical protein JTE90_015784 [Oedothorax gibbosus]|uniref:Adenylyltransferase and sulfurtransferase MOCS3 homolog n=1 Tax=Oedothorax gibbosus TaxID=931172 RepID=A0AAV6VW18_9ARAC|nr:hypothetical protein JTE90_015784 [Oedothorax gibbosus]
MEEEIKRLKHLISQRDAEIARLNSLLENKVDFSNYFSEKLEANPSLTLTSDEISKYSRQLILPEIGVEGQIRLKQTSVLIIGAGGLGCPAAIYLAAAGVGHIGIIDHDVVDVSNLHRQVAHKYSSVGQSKSESLKNSLKNLNPEVEISTYSVLLSSENIKDIIKPYSILVDATDNVPTRYLLNDAAVLYDKYLVSGSALRFEGQLTVYNYKDGPCYRCLFPKPPSAGAVTNCSESGVLGVITGVIGCLQALEVIKIAVGLEPNYYKKLLLLDGLGGRFREIKLRSRVADCNVCGQNPTITELIDYEEFCNLPATDSNANVSLLSESDRISCSDYKKIVDSGRKHVLVDVRPSNEVAICSLPNSVNVPMNKIALPATAEKLKDLVEMLDCKDNFVVCRRGNDSQKAVLELRKLVSQSVWQDIKGGLHAWHDEIDPTFPKY